MHECQFPIQSSDEDRPLIFGLLLSGTQYSIFILARPDDISSVRGRALPVGDNVQFWVRAVIPPLHM